AESEELSAAVAQFQTALQAARHGERTPTKTRIKEEARLAAEQIMRRLGNIIRANPKIPAVVKMELGVNLREGKAKQLTVPPEAPIPAHPGANLASRPWYLRSYTRSPIRIIPPLARMPMQVVYWGRWADSAGNVGPFSATAVAWIEGGSHHRLSPAIAWDQK